MLQRAYRKDKEKQGTVIAFDPSLCAWGWVVMQGNTVLDSGCIKTGSENKVRRIRKGDDRIRRVNEINQILISLFQKYNVQHILTEQPHGSQNASAAVMIGMCTGIIQAFSDAFHISVEWFTEGDSKQALLGKRSAGKDETIRAITSHYKVKWTGKKYIDEAVADALSVYFCAQKTSDFLKFFQ